MRTSPLEARKTYFGITALIVAIISVFFLTAYFGVSQLNISPSDFNFWNIVTAFISCVFAPIAFVLAYFAWRSARDSRRLASIAVAITGIPFLILFTQFVASFIR